MAMVIINGRFLLHRTTGVERYAKEILAELDRIAEPGRFELAIPMGVKETPKYENIKVVKVGRLTNRLWEHVSFPAYVHRKKGISLNLCNVAPLVSPGIVCIHDMKINATPQFFSKAFLLWYRILFWNETRRAKRIITDSEFSKEEICRYYHVDRERISIIPMAWQHYQRIDYDEGTLEKYGVTKGNYYFSMSSLEPNKNFRWIAEEARRNPDQIFAVAGSINKTVFSDGLGFECPPNMILLGYVGDKEGKTLMRDCKAFLFPSFYEGFGIPPLEALSAGARSVVVSDTDVMHEVFEDAVNYVNPNHFDVDMRSLIACTNEQADRILAKFSWKKSAELLFDILKDN